MSSTGTPLGTLPPTGGGSPTRKHVTTLADQLTSVGDDAVAEDTLLRALRKAAARLADWHSRLRKAGRANPENPDEETSPQTASRALTAEMLSLWDSLKGRTARALRHRPDLCLIFTGDVPPSTWEAPQLRRDACYKAAKNERAAL